MPAAPVDVWERVRLGFQLEPVEQPRIDRELARYLRDRESLERVFGRAEPFLYHIAEALEERGMPLELALLPMVESAYDPFAYSHGRASGLWQFIPGTGRRYGLAQNWWYDGRRDVTESTRAALDYLQKLAGDFDGDWLLAVAGYNSGEGNVRKAIRRNERGSRPTDFWNLKLPRETRAYVPRLLALQRVVRDPSRYDITLAPVANEPWFETVAVDGQIDLSVAADLAGLDTDALSRLNAGFNRWATPPDGPHRLLVPVARAPALQAGLEALPPEQRVRWQRHRIRRGDTLGGIARRYGTTVAVIRRANGVRGSRIRAGDHLLIPTATRSLAAYGRSQDARLAETLAASSDGLRYRVRPGDTLWDIARAHDVSVRALARWNGMAPGDPLSVGRELRIRQPARTARTSPASASPVPGGPVRRIHYVVRRGDSLWRISSRFGVSVEALRGWNRLGRGGVLRPGQKLVLYVDVTQQSAGG